MRAAYLSREAAQACFAGAPGERQSGYHFAPDGVGCEARILIAQRNFACGSSREHAVWALCDRGFRAAIAPSFGDIFSSNAMKNGFLPVVLPEAAVACLLAALQAAPGMRIEVNLETQTVAAAGETHHFEIAPFAKRCLLEGLDELGYTLSQMAHIEAFERQAGS